MWKVKLGNLYFTNIPEVARGCMVHHFEQKITFHIKWCFTGYDAEMTKSQVFEFHQDKRLS